MTHRSLSSKPRIALPGLKALLLLAACTFTLTAGGDCTTFNPQTFLDGSSGPSDLTTPLPDIHHLDAPNLVTADGVGDTFRIEVRAEDANGNPMPDTEARVNVEYDETMLELVRVCGGQDINDHNSSIIHECRPLVPSYHVFVNDGVMWFKFRALQDGETDVRFVYPGVVVAGFTGNPRPTPGPFPTTPGPVLEGGYTEEVTTHVVIGGAASDEDDDGVPDFEDECPDTPSGSDVDEDGCPIGPADEDGDGVSDEDDFCPGTPPGTDVLEDGCPAGDAEPADLDDIAPSSFVFRSENTSLACGFTDVADETAAATSNEGGIMPLRVDTFHPQNDPGPAPTTTVRGPYDPSTGRYIANGTSAVGAEHELEGFWTEEPDGDPRFDGTLVERFLSPTCENTFDVTYTID